MKKNRETKKTSTLWRSRSFCILATTLILWVWGDIAQPQATSCQVGTYDCAGQLYLSNGNVGIGTTSPGAILDVGVGSVQCCATQTPNISLAQGSNANGQMSWLQFHNSGEAEAYIRLAGGGPAGGPRAGQRRLEIGDSQNVKTGLTVTGNVAAAGGFTQPGTGGETLRIVRGYVNPDGTIRHGSGFTVSKQSPGIYSITFVTPFASPPTVVASPFLQSHAQVGFPSNGTVIIYIQNLNDTNADGDFNFIAVGPA